MLCKDCEISEFVFTQSKHILQFLAGVMEVWVQNMLMCYKA